MAKLTIPSPQFDKAQDVWLLFHGATIPTSVKVRAYDPDKDRWLYRVAMSGQWHPAEELVPRYANAVEGQSNG